MKDKNEAGQVNSLWTRDFKIITAGSVISMFGNAMSGFAMSLMVLDISNSTLLFSIYMAMYTLPQLIMPIVSGAILDRFSRKRTIYTLDFIAATLYLIMSGILATGWFSFPLFAAYCFVLGSIQSIYMVAYDSFYPLLISEGNYQKAYSVASVLETTSSVMVPVSTFLYGKLGLSPLLAVNGISFFIAALMEMQIEAEEEYIHTQLKTRLEGSGHIRQMTEDLKEGFRYLAGERGLMAIAAYFAFSAACGGAGMVLILPYFKKTFTNGEYWFMLVQGALLLGRAIGGGLHYRHDVPVNLRFRIALTVYIVISVFEGVYLFFPIPVMCVLTFLIGIGGVTSYTIRISATQSYVPDEKKGRFNGSFNVMCTMGTLVGEFTSGLLATFMSERIILLGVMMLCAVAAIVIIGGDRRHVEPIYNRIS